MSKGEVIIYQTPEGDIALDVKVDGETVWLSLNQIADLFDKDKSVISRHINNIYKEGELERDATVAKNATVQYEGDRSVIRNIEYYNLDVIISVGYRVKSKRGIQFRIWATNTVRDYLVRGYVVNKRLKESQLQELKEVVRLATKTAMSDELSDIEKRGLMQVISDYTYALDTLDKYDYQELEISDTTSEESFRATYETAISAIEVLRDKFGSSRLFGNEKDESFKSSISTIYQTFDRKELYPSVEEKAAMLLYLVVKNHSFSDGNKRIAAFLFLWFLESNGILYRRNGAVLVENNALVALTLMIAESHPEEKDIMVKMVVNLINKKN